MAVIEIDLPQEILERLENESRSSGESLNNLIVKALSIFISQYPPGGIYPV